MKFTKFAFAAIVALSAIGASAQVAASKVSAEVGYTNTTLKASAAGVSASSTKDSGAYGVGLSYHITPAVYLSTDYTSYYEQSGDSVQGWTVGVGYKF